MFGIIGVGLIIGVGRRWTVKKLIGVGLNNRGGAAVDGQNVNRGV